MAFLPPEDGGVAVPPLTGSQRRARRRCLDRAAQLREERARRSPHPSPPAGERGRVWQSLSQKDRALPVDEALVEDGLRAFSWEGGLPSWVFEKGLLSPRVGLEALSPWRQLLEGRFSPEERNRFREAPSRLWNWVLSQASLCREAYAALWGTPAGILQVGGATAAGQGLLFCAACRALGIPAYLEDGIPWYWREGAFHPLWGGEKSARLTLAAPRGRGAVSGQDYTLSRREAGGWRPLEGVDVLPGGEGEAPLAPGQYRLWTVTRLPNGSQLARWEEFTLAAGEARRTALAFREGEAAQMLERCPLPAFSLEGPDGDTLEGREIFSQSAFTLLLWLEVSREPTEHLLNELREQASQLQGTGCAVALVLEGWEERKDPTLARTLEAMPWARLWKGDFPEAVPALARRMYQDPDRLPLALLVNRQGEGLFACCGYNVGTGALLLRLLAAAGEG